MIRTFLIPLIAIVGVLLAAVTVVRGSRPPNAQPPVVAPPHAPFETFVAGSGLIEAASQNIAIGTPISALAVSVPVTVGDTVAAGASLFELDPRDVKAELAVREAAAKVAADQLARLEAGTRPEALPVARARLAAAESTLADEQDRRAMWEKLSDPKAVSADEVSRRRFAVRTAQARLDEAKADLTLLEVGSWSADIAVARSQLLQAQALANASRVEVDRRTVRAPVAGRILQVNIRAGEFAQAGPQATPLMLMGTVSPLHVRIDVDENEAWRVKAGARAMAYIRGNKDLSTAITFVRFEPYVIPKHSLTGDSAERVDTRVLQVLYSFDPKDMPVFVGQQMDVYIEAAPLPPSPQRPPPAR